jgi:aryl-alcohol dehydrogenase-like predicted oxidoreductase
MEYRDLGRSGLKVSPLCLGAMNFGECIEEMEAFHIIQEALDAGINFIDTSNSYGDGESERMLGEALANGKREKVVLASKFYFPQSQVKHRLARSISNPQAFDGNSARRDPARPGRPRSAGKSPIHWLYNLPHLDGDGSIGK